MKLKIVGEMPGIEFFLLLDRKVGDVQKEIAAANRIKGKMKH